MLTQCALLRHHTRGFFDVTADPRWPLDPSGFVKGWSADVASDRLASMGAGHHAINAGGDLRLRTPEAAVPWTVGIVHRFLAGELTASTVVANGAVAPSSTHERGCRVVDPHTGAAALDLAAVTVVGTDLGRADAYATAALAMGVRSAPQWLDSIGDHDSLVIDAAGGAWSTRGFARSASGLPKLIGSPSS